MPIDRGKYDDACTLARVESEAQAIALIVFAGKHGTGFSVQAYGETARSLPALLRIAANDLDKEFAQKP